MTRILLADDHRIILDGLRALLKKQPDIEVVGDAQDGVAAVRLAEELCPDIVIMDIGMPKLNGIDATRQIYARMSDIKIIVLSMHCDRTFVHRMLKMGVSGYVLKDCAFEELIHAIEAVSTGNIYLSQAVTRMVVKECLPEPHSSGPTAYDLLSPREREILQLLAEGRKTKSVASYLKVSEKTVQTLRIKIMTKLNLGSTAELTKYAIKEGLTSLSQ